MIVKDYYFTTNEVFLTLQQLTNLRRRMHYYGRDFLQLPRYAQKFKRPVKQVQFRPRYEVVDLLTHQVTAQEIERDLYYNLRPQDSGVFTVADLGKISKQNSGTSPSRKFSNMRPGVQAQPFYAVDQKFSSLYSDQFGDQMIKEESEQNLNLVPESSDSDYGVKFQRDKTRLGHEIGVTDLDVNSRKQSEDY